MRHARWSHDKKNHPQLPRLTPINHHALRPETRHYAVLGLLPPPVLVYRHVPNLRISHRVRYAHMLNLTHCEPYLTPVSSGWARVSTCTVQPYQVHSVLSTKHKATGSRRLRRTPRRRPHRPPALHHLELGGHLATARGLKGGLCDLEGELGGDRY